MFENFTSRQPDLIEIGEFFEELLNYVNILYSLFLILVGCVCNPLSFIVLRRQAFRKSTMSIYLSILSIIDLVALLNGVVRLFLIHAVNIEIRFNNIACKLSIFIGYVFTYVSTWILVIVTTERVISIIWPHRVSVWCSRFKAKMSIAVTCIIMSVISLPYIFIYGETRVQDTLDNTVTIASCGISSQDETLNFTLWIWDSIMFPFLPSLLLIVFNMIIGIGVMRSRHKFKETRHLTYSSNSKSQSGTSSPRRPDKPKRESSLTLTLFTINTAYIICTFPRSIWIFLPFYHTDTKMTIIEDRVTEFVVLLLYSNNAINFFLYCLTGSKFRTETNIVLGKAVQWFRSLF